MKFLSLNCQHGEQPQLGDFLRRILNSREYDILLLQEVEEKVMAILDHPAYQLVRSFNKETGCDSQLCIAYRTGYKLSKIGFRSFSSMRYDPVRGFKHPCFGLLWAEIDAGEGILRAASTHLHSGIDRHVRLKELQIAKEILLSEGPGRVMLAGDFNAGFPREPKDMAGILTPDFAWLSEGCGPTLDSRYSENTAHLPSRIAAFLGLFNIGIHLRCDHVFIDKMTFDKGGGKCSVLPDRVSDHSPVEFILA